jgi:hypothetical protein
MVAAREVGSIFCFQSPSATVDFRPTRFVSIDSHLGAKMRAIEAFSSQLAVRAYLEPDLISATARYWSRFAEGRYAEAFEVIRDGAGLAPGHAAARPASRPVIPQPAQATPALQGAIPGGAHDSA